MARILKFTAIDVAIASNSGEFRGSICEVGVAVVKSGEIVDSWSQLINPQTKDSDWSRRNIAIHGIRPEAVRAAPTFKGILPKIRRSVANGRIVSHSRFDEDVVRRACERLGLRMLKNEWRNSLVLAHRAWPNEPSHSLPEITKKLGIRYNPRDAGGDARVVAELVLRAARIIGIKRVNDWLKGVVDF